MNLRSANPYWLLKHGLISNYPSLTENKKTEIIVMGAGITGALCAWHLCQQGFKVIVCDRRHVGTGSTAASTALLQYEIDTPLWELSEKVGEANAVRSYELCAYSIEALERICKRFDGMAGYRNRHSVQYASFKSHVPDLEKEFNLRKKHGFPVRWWSEDKVKQHLHFDAPAALYSEIGAEIDAYQLAHLLLQQCIRKGAQVYDNTEVVAVNHHKNSVSIKTKEGFEITAKHLVIACGYESQRYLPQQVEQLHATYAIVSEPMPDQKFWYRNCLIWETADPYLYLRSTTDRRVLIGGLDDDTYAPEKREKRLPAKAKQLREAFLKKFPDIPFKTDFQWAGSFASTKDGLPYIGGIRQRPNTWFALGFGGNGITFSLLAAEQITAAISGQPEKDMEIFSFSR